MHDHFGIGFCAKNVSVFKQVFAKFLIVINLSVEDDPDGSILVRERLVASSKIDDGKAAKPKPNLAGQIVSLVIWAAMHDGVCHRFQQLLRNFVIAVEI